MGTHILADTNAGIDFLNDKLPAASTAWFQRALDVGGLALSVVVQIELLSWLGSPADLQLLEDFIAATIILPLDESVVQQTILLRQQHRIKLPDAIMAATALVHGLPLLTRNTADFQKVAGLVVMDPHDSAQLPAR